MDVSLTLESTSVVSLANYKFVSNHSSPDLRYLPARDDGDRTMKHSSSELDMCGIPITPLVLRAPARAHDGQVEVSGWEKFGVPSCAVVHSAIWRYCCKKMRLLNRCLVLRFSVW